MAQQQNPTVPLEVHVKPAMAVSGVSPRNKMQKNAQDKWEVTGQQTTKDGVPIWELFVMLPGMSFGRPVLEKIPVRFETNTPPEINPGDMVEIVEAEARVSAISAKNIRPVSKSAPVKE